MALVDDDNSINTQQLLDLNQEFLEHDTIRTVTPSEALPRPQSLPDQAAVAAEAAQPADAFVRPVMDPRVVLSARNKTNRTSPRTYSKRSTTIRDALIDRRALGFHASSQSDAHPPQLRKVHLTPRPDMAAMELSPRPYHFFTQASGDTQRIETQVYKDAGEWGTTSNASIAFEDARPSEGQWETQAVEVDLLDHLSDDGAHQLSESWSSDHESPQAEFKVPKTPGLAGSKRNSMGNVVSSMIRSSSSRPPPTVIKKIFGHTTGAVEMSFTQAFVHTQNISSPIADLRSDPVFERPSPGFDLEPRPSVALAPPSTSDPIDHYKPMEESQEERNRRQKEQQARMAEDDEDDSLMGSQPTELERRLRRQELEQRKREALMKFDEPPRPRSVPTTSTNGQLVTPVRKTAGATADEPIHVPAGTPVSEDEESEVESSPEKAVQVPMTSSRGKSLPELPITSNPSKRIDHKIMNPHDQEIDAEATAHGSGTQRSLVVTNSPAVAMEANDVPLSQGSDTRIAQSQYSVPVSKSVESSSVRPPPLTTSQAQEDALASSPPGTGANEADVEPCSEVTAAANHSPRQSGKSAEEAVQAVFKNLMVIDGPEGVRFVVHEDQSKHDSILTTVPESDPIDLSNQARQSDVAVRRRGSEMFSKADTSEPASRAVYTLDFNSNEQFDTAETHQTVSNLPRLPTQPSTTTEESPVRRGQVRKLTEIAVNAASQISHPSVDFNLLNDDDQQHLEAINGKGPKNESAKSTPDSSPIHATKRRRLNRSHSLGKPARKVNLIEHKTSSNLGDDVLQLSDDEENAPEDITPYEPAPLKHADRIAKSQAPTKGKLTRPSKKPITYTSRRNSPDKEPSKPQAEPTLGEAVKPKPTKLRVDSAITTPSDTKHLNTVNDVTVPKRVFAFFGPEHAYFPATYLDKPHPNDLHEIRFDDGTTVQVERKHIFRLDLRPGDVVRIWPDRATKYVVHGFKDELDPSKTDFPLTDIGGFETVILASSNRKSTSGGAPTKAGLIEEKLTNIFLTQLGKFGDRLYHPLKLEAPSIVNRRFTPSETGSAPGSPSGRSRRRSAKEINATKVESSFKTDPIVHSRVFANMVFAISLSTDDDSKNDVIKCVLQNGGHVLDYGFDGLFDQSGASNADARDDEGERDSLYLRASAKDTGFTALLASSHSRTAKYMQALALGLPCLHYRWVLDCVASGKVLSWPKYLLPAGESLFLGAVRSRTLAPYDPLSKDDARLETVVGKRQKLLGGLNVLFVTGKGRQEEKKKAYEFLTVALGARNVVKVRDMPEARATISGTRVAFDIVYAEGGNEIKEALLAGDGTCASGAGKGRKRKRISASERSVMQGKGRPKFVSDEFIVQSLILGDLVESIM